MKKLLFLLTAGLLFIPTYADNKQLLEELDATIEQRPQFIDTKEKTIALLLKSLNEETDSTVILRIVEKLFNEYHVYKFDSAMMYANKGLEIAMHMHNDYFVRSYTIHLAEILSIGGLYHEAISKLDALDSNAMEQKLLFRYYFTYSITYSYWSDYCHDKTFSPRYRHLGNEYLKKAMLYASPDNPFYHYYKGEHNVYVSPNSKEARKHYHHILNTVDEKSRIYAMSAFALAGNYKEDGDMEKYEEYLIRASMSDLKCCTMENMALQTLALLLFQKGGDNIKRAEHYIRISMEDAKLYNNRLRILEISRILPQIMSAYQETVEKKNSVLLYSVIFISMLLIGLLRMLYYIRRQNRKLNVHNIKQTRLNQQLEDGNWQQAELNRQLQRLNEQLVHTNKHREGLASIYIDLCAKYIDKLSRFQTLVRRKIKANQAQELLQTISSTRISEEDAATFLNRFDRAFLELYPSFVDEFNALLVESARIQLKTPHSMTTELRTFALIRLGVKSTTDIAGLLFLSTQTIYNCRSAMRNKAKNRESFDDDVLRLCTVVQ